MPRDSYWFEPYHVTVRALPRVTPQNFDYSLGVLALMRHCETLVRESLQRQLDEARRETVGAVNRALLIEGQLKAAQVERDAAVEEAHRMRHKALQSQVQAASTPSGTATSTARAPALGSFESTAMSNTPPISGTKPIKKHLKSPRLATSRCLATASGHSPRASNQSAGSATTKATATSSQIKTVEKVMSG